MAAEPFAQAAIVITGIQAAGKSTVAQLLAERLPNSVHLRGDLFRRMIINGRVDMAPDATDEAQRQLRLRHRLTAQSCDQYTAAGFTVITQDVVLGEHFPELAATIRTRPLYLVVLAPSPEEIGAREAARGKVAYDEWSVRALDAVLRDETPRLGLWLDTSEQAPEETVDDILRRAPAEAAV
ncbi:MULTISPECIES: AAA family ATPase [unclassified Saccharopolyspora]|uniref:AAA family ATPase n=1 Tax=unclassified Saccharopolyspora TaxID=2646250 RepID=UPI001CD39D79|nr:MULTISPECIES: AAA family ATPase [unclassified Saccharopolyspora]MCA1190408.1 AAA family ATPase [Saccharopolyspora sp. 6T]MCA1195899.1 AAA family ATPase [Saccharopolyspora sp. 6V]